VPAQLQNYSRGAQLRRGLGELRLGLLFGGRDTRPALRAKQRRGNAGAGEPHHQHLFAREFDDWFHSNSYLNFSVVSENSANTSAMIQNRTMVFDSLHPPSSK
jgi:hypothetical protein